MCRLARFSDSLRCRTDEHDLIYMTYNGRMRCDKETADRPTFETKSEKYSWLSDVQSIGKMVEFKPGKEGHLIYDLFVIK